ncbi:MAG: AraC family transcriptional regulator [Planctomycetota bacterium]
MVPNSDSLVDASHAGTIVYNVTFERISNVVRFSDATLSTTLPRGGLQITQPRQTDLQRMRAYSRQEHGRDPVAWQALTLGVPVRLSDVRGTAEPGDVHRGNDLSTSATGQPLGPVADAFAESFLKPNGLAHYAAIPLDGPILAGYRGLLHLYRTQEIGDFSIDELLQLLKVAADFDEAHARQQEIDRFKHDNHPLAHHLVHRQFAIVRGRRIVSPRDKDDVLDDVLRHNLLDIVDDRLNVLETEAPPPSDEPADPRLKPKAAGSNADRLLVPDRLGDCWVFRLTMFPRYPAITGVLDRDEPVAFASHQPDCEAWSSLRPSDFAADDEIGRLIPAMQFMQENYAGDASLQRIAKTVHLSPFHFHRRFTDLLGITPKHYLFDCQIAESKRQLAARTKDLKQIAADCGFAHQSHFTSRFKQATGLTPTQWRRLATEPAVDNDAKSH